MIHGSESHARFRYVVIEEGELGKLASSVADMMQSGWKPAGGPFVTQFLIGPPGHEVQGTPGRGFAQAMVYTLE